MADQIIKITFHSGSVLGE